MSSATLNIKVSPRRMLSEREAAEYCGLPARRFATVCDVSPIDYPGGFKLYDMRDLDRWIDSIKGGAAPTDADILGKLA